MEKIQIELNTADSLDMEEAEPAPCKFYIPRKKRVISLSTFIVMICLEVCVKEKYIYIFFPVILLYCVAVPEYSRSIVEKSL